MKKENTNTEISTTVWKDSEIEELIPTEAGKVKAEAIQKAEDLAEAKLPREGDDLHTYTSWITSKFNDLKSRVVSKQNIEGLITKGSSIVSRCAKRENELMAKSFELTSKLRDVKKELLKVDAEDNLQAIRTWRRIHLLVVLLIVIEALALEQAMGVLSSAGMVARGIIAGGVCLSTYFLAKKHVVLVRNASSRLAKYAINIGMFSVAAIVFVLFGVLRMSYLTEMHEEMAARSSEYIFAAVSMVFFLGCVIAKSLFMPSAEDRKRVLKYTQKKTERDNMQEEMKEAEAERHMIAQERERDLYKIYSIIKVSEKYLEQVDFAYETIIGEFILHNTIKRHDGITISMSQYKGGVIPLLTQYEFKTQEL